MFLPKLLCPLNRNGVAGNGQGDDEGSIEKDLSHPPGAELRQGICRRFLTNPVDLRAASSKRSPEMTRSPWRGPTEKRAHRQSGSSKVPLRGEGFVELLQVFLGPGRIAGQPSPTLFNSHCGPKEPSPAKTLQPLANLLRNAPDSHLPTHVGIIAQECRHVCTAGRTSGRDDSNHLARPGVGYQQ